MIQTRTGAIRRSVAVALVSSAMLLVGLGQGSAYADVTAVTGSAYGYYCTVTAFGLVCSPAAKTPLVTLAADASNSPQIATAPSGNASAGPATIFSSGQIGVSTQGTLGPGGSVSSSTDIGNVNASGNEPFTAASLASSCTASETAVSGSTTITGGTLQIDSGDSDPTNTIPNHAPVNVTLPANPAPNTSYDGHLHFGNTTDNFRYVFNEQIVNPDGSITVNAAHEYLGGPFATGDMIIGQSVCGVTTGAPPPGGSPPDAVPALKSGACANAKSGTIAADTLLGTPAGDKLFGLAGNDLLTGLAGDDCLFGGSGADRLLGGPGRDMLRGDDGNDVAVGGAGSDSLLGGSGRDTLRGDDGNDPLSGGSGNDKLTGGAGRNRYSAGSGKDTVNARNGKRERVDCGTGRDKASVDLSDRVRRCELVRRK